METTCWIVCYDIVVQFKSYYVVWKLIAVPEFEILCPV